MAEAAFYAWRLRKAEEKGGQRFVLLKPKDAKRRGKNIKPLVSGRKAWLFSNTKKGAGHVHHHGGGAP